GSLRERFLYHIKIKQLKIPRSLVPSSATERRVDRKPRGDGTLAAVLERHQCVVAQVKAAGAGAPGTNSPGDVAPFASLDHEVALRVGRRLQDVHIIRGEMNLGAGDGLGVKTLDGPREVNTHRAARRRLRLGCRQRQR